MDRDGNASKIAMTTAAALRLRAEMLQGEFSDERPPPATAGEWKLVRSEGELPLGQGHFATVWHGRLDTTNMPDALRKNDRVCVIKLLRQRWVGKAYEESRMGAEIKALTTLDECPISPTLFSYGVAADGRSFIAMEEVKGERLDVFLESRFSSREGSGLNDCIALFEDLCKAVHYVHRWQIAHRDLSEANVLVVPLDAERYSIRLIDFGQAAGIGKGPWDEAFRQDDRRHRCGTYSPPEQRDPPANYEVNAAADVYAIGFMLYRNLFDIQPFGEEGPPTEEAEAVRPSEAFAGLAVEEQERLASRLGTTRRGLLAGLQSDLDAILMNAVAWDWKKRYKDPGALAEALHRFRTAGTRGRARLARYAAVAAATFIAGGAMAAAVRAMSLNRQVTDLGKEVARLHAKVAQEVNEANATKSRLGAVAGERDRWKQRADDAEALGSRIERSRSVSADEVRLLRELWKESALPDPTAAGAAGVDALGRAAEQIGKLAGSEASPQARVGVLFWLGDCFQMAARLAAAEECLRAAVELMGSAGLAPNDRGELLFKLATFVRDSDRPERQGETLVLYERAWAEFASADPPNRNMMAIVENERRVREEDGAFDRIDTAPYIPILAVVRGKAHGAVYDELKNSLNLAAQQAGGGDMPAAVQTLMMAAAPYEENLLTKRFVPTAVINLTLIGKVPEKSKEPLMLAAVRLVDRLHARPCIETAYVHYKVGQFYVNAGRFADALPYLEFACRMAHGLMDSVQPDHPKLLDAELLYGRAILRTASGDSKKVSEAIERANFAHDGFSKAGDARVIEADIVAAEAEAVRGRAEAARERVERAARVFEAAKPHLDQAYARHLSREIESVRLVVDRADPKVVNGP